MNEAKFTTKFKTWFDYNRHLFPNSAALEFKVTKGNTFNIKKWLKDQGHQLVNLRNSTNGSGVYHKISDQSSGVKPFDSFFIKNADSFFIVYFNNQKKFFVLPFSFLVTKIEQISISYTELEKDLIAYELPKKEKPPVLIF